VVSVGRNELSRRNGGDRVLEAELDPLTSAGTPELLLPALRVGAGVRADEHGARPDAVRDAKGFLNGVAAADRNVSAALAQRVPQVGERVV
jgi:hypothetical protein